MKLDDLPVLGVGIGYRNELRTFYAEHDREIDWFELIADRYFSTLPESSDWLVDFREHHRLSPHGLDLSLGTDEALDPAYSRQAAELCRLVRAPFYSDHLCMTQAGGVQLGHLTPLPFTRRAARRVAEKARAVQDLLGVPFLLENIAYSFALPSEMSEVDFVSTVVEEADCGILLDLTNLFVNAENHGYDAYDYLRRLPLERVVQIHLAGSERHRGKWVDAHSRSVEAHPEVWSLLEYVVKRSPVRAILLERDQDFPEDPSELVADLRRAREIFTKSRAEPVEPEEPRHAPPEISAAGSSGPRSGREAGLDALAFQSLFASVLVDRDLRRRLAETPAAFAEEMGIDAGALSALQSAGLEELDDFASSLENKRFEMLGRSSPALYALLERSGTLERVHETFVERCPPKEAPEYPNRTIRDAFWAQELVRALVAEGALAVEHAGDVAHFEHVLLGLSVSAARVDSARFFQSQQKDWAALSNAELLRSYPRRGSHTSIETFASEVTAVVRALMDGGAVPPPAPRPTKVLFVKRPGMRNVQFFQINDATERLLALADGKRSGAEIAAELGKGRDKTADMIRRLVEQNVLAIDPTLAA